MTKTMLLQAASVAVVLSLTTGGAAFAQAVSEGPPPLEQVLVASRSLEDTLPETLARTGVKVDVITDKQIRQGGYVDIATSLQALAPGLYVQPKNGPFDYVDISLRGSRTSDVLFLVDGVRINNRLYAGTTPLDTLPSAIVDRIEVLQGGQSLFYGTQAVAGAVNIVTKPFSDKLDGQVSVAGDTNDSGHVDGYVRNAIGKHRFVLYGAWDKSDGYHAFREQDYQPSSTHRNRGYDVYTLGGKYAYDFTDQLRLSASLQHDWADVDFALPFRVTKDVNSRQEDIATLKLDYDMNDRLSFYLKGYYHHWWTKYDTTYNDLATPGAQIVLYKDTPWEYNDAGLNALGKYKVAKGVEAWFGYDYQSYGGQDAVLVIEPNHEDTNAVFGQIRLTPDLIPRTHLAAGFRYNAPSKGEDATVWNVSGQYDLTDHLFIRGEGGTNFRLPTAEELFANDPLDERGNPNLKPERSTSANASIGGNFDVGGVGLRLELIGFWREVKDLIDFDTFDDVTQQGVFGNVAGKVKVRGGEFQADAKLSSSLSASVNYTANSSKTDTGAQLDRTPKSLVKAGLDWHPANLPFGASLNLNHTGEEHVAVGGVEQEYGDYTVVDLSGRWFLDKNRRQRLNLAIQNLFDEGYGLPSRGCRDVKTDGPFDCSSPYVYENRNLPRTVRLSYTMDF